MKDVCAVMEVIGKMPASASLRGEKLEKMLRNEVHRHALVLESVLQSYGVGFTLKVSVASRADDS